MRSSSLESTRSERGFVLIAVLILAILYLGLMELMLSESSEVLRQASRFRSRIVAQSLAEDGVELAARGIVARASVKARWENDDGTVEAEMKRTGDEFFEISSRAVTSGVQSSTATVQVSGHVVGTAIIIDRTIHSQ